MKTLDQSLYSNADVKRYRPDMELISAFMAEIGAEKVPDDIFDKWYVRTIFGTLQVEISPGLEFVACKFSIVPPKSERDKLPAAGDLNPYSGKWNCCMSKNGRLNLRESILAFQERVRPILTR